MLANADRIVAKIKGTGGHGAAPHTAIDPVFLSAQVVTALQSVVARRVKPTAPAVVTVGSIHGGTAYNIIPGEVTLDMTLRSTTAEVRQQLLDEVEKALSVARALGGDYEMAVIPGCPALVNDATVTDWLRDTASQLIGPENVVEREAGMGYEDFAYMAQASRGAMIFLGTKAPDGPPRSAHHPEFDIDEAAMPLGAAVLAQTALRYVRGEFG